MKIATAPCARMFICSSFNSQLWFFKLKFVGFDSIVSWMQRAFGFSLAIWSTNSGFLFAILWMFYCMIFVVDIWYYISWSFIFLVFSLFCRLQLAVGRADSFSFDHLQTQRWVTAWRTFLICMNIRSSSVWQPHSAHSLIKKLQAVQKPSIRLAARCTSTTPSITCINTTPFIACNSTHNFHHLH